MRSGQILIKTKNSIQANKLVTLTSISPNITVEISLHNSLNSSKGVIYCNDLRNIVEKEILEELKSEKVIDVKKILKKQNDSLVETGLIVLTFNTTNLPSKINIGYSKINVRTYIPPPMRCSNCLRYNHTAKFCTNSKICFNCREDYHINDSNGETCLKGKKCSNCVFQNISPSDHTAKEKRCPIFVKEAEIQAIKTTYKIDNKAAKQLYAERHQHNVTAYSTIASNSQTLAIKTPQTAQNLTPTINRPISPVANHHSNRPITNYSDIPTFTAPPDKERKQIVKILPRNTPKRLQNKIKKTISTVKTSKEKNPFYEETDSDYMDVNA